MKLKTFARAKDASQTVNSIRRDGNIPAVIYAAGQKGSNLTVDGHAFNKILSTIRKGYLSTTVFELESDEGTVKAIVKDIQYHITTYSVLHIDFLELSDDRLFTVNVPIVLDGVSDSPGVKQGGVANKVIRSFKVSCKPKDLPKEFHVSVAGLEVKGTKRLRDITLPEGVTPAVDVREVVAVIAKR